MNSCLKSLRIESFQKRMSDTYVKRNRVEVGYGILKTYVEGGLDYVRSDTTTKRLMFVQMVATAIKMHLLEMIYGTNLKDMGIPLMIHILNTLHVCEGDSSKIERGH